MDINVVNEELVSKLPKEGVHCFAANSKQITTRRVITGPLTVILVAVAMYFLFGSDKSIPLACICFLGVLICVLVFVHTYLIAKYRIAVDYNEKNIVLRYRYSLITIPFENLDAREGEPDKAEALIENSNLSSGEKVYYLVLDNVLDDACYQTTTKDLASREDFFTLQTEVFAIAEAYGARNLENAIKPTAMKNTIEKSELSDDMLDNIVDEVAKETEEEKKSK